MKFVFIFAIIVKTIFASELAADFVQRPVDLEDVHDVVKRQATSPPKKEDSNNYTSVKTTHGCKLYALEVSFFKKKVTEGESSKYDTAEVKVPGTSLKSISDGSCGGTGNLSGTIVLDYVGKFPADKGGKGLTELTLTFHIAYRRAFGWWELTELGVAAVGDLVDSSPFNQTFNGTVMKSMAIGASKKFCYACSQPPTIYYSMDEKHTTIYGLKFKNLQIQPFEWKRNPGNFTNNVDDCVPFFSIGIWMFLIVAGVLLLVIFFGIGMISSLKTMDRFDDPKGKPLVISAKD